MQRMNMDGATYRRLKGPAQPWYRMTRRKRDDLSPAALKKRIGDQQQCANFQFAKSCEGSINFFPIACV